MSKNEELSPIEMKKESTSNTNISNYKNFGIAVLKNAVYLILVGFIGSNFLYISLLKDKNILFPTDEDKLPYAEGSGSGQSGGNNCTKNKSMFNSSKGLKYKGGTSDDFCNTSKDIEIDEDDDDSKVGFPYNYITNDPDTLFSIFKNIIGRCTRDSYIIGRVITKNFFKSFNKHGDIGHNALFIFSPIMLFVIVLYQIPLIIGGFTTFMTFILYYFELMYNYGKISMVLITIILGAFIFGIDIGWSFLVGITQMFRLYGMLLFYPLINDLDAVRKIFASKSKILIFLFILLTIISAFNHLSTILAITMTICLTGMFFFLNK